MSERERWYFSWKKVANLSLNKSISELKVDWPSLCDRIWSNLCLLHPAALACREYWEPASGCFLISDNKVVVFWQKGCRKLKTNFIRFCQLQRSLNLWLNWKSLSHSQKILLIANSLKPIQHISSRSLLPPRLPPRLFTFNATDLISQVSWSV